MLHLSFLRSNPLNIDRNRKFTIMNYYTLIKYKKPFMEVGLFPLQT